MRALAFSLTALVSLSALAAEPLPRKFGIMSLSGDSISTYNAITQSGTRVGQLRRNLIPLNNTAFDDITVQAANKAVQQVEPATPTAMLLTLDGKLYQAQNAMFDNPSANKAELEYLQSLLAERGISHLILVSKLNAESEVRLNRSTEERGRIEGLGFYLDNGIRIKDDESRQSGHGVIAPFAYVKLRLIDASSMQVIKEVIQKQSSTIGNLRGESGLYAWNVLSAGEKVSYMETLLNAAMTKGVPQLLGATRASADSAQLRCKGSIYDKPLISSR
ncbi:hypothetical protein [Pseudoduganella sp. RAF53_2]|uniref:hypothetical protein n=1 Tax=unclassified Pseudoduganella TaxID=2637179 RepID=UPI003F9B1C27